MPLTTQEFNSLYEIVNGTHQEIEELYHSCKDDEEFLEKKRDFVIAKLREMTEKEQMDI